METTLKSSAFRTRDCENRFMAEGPFWHLCTDGTRQVNIFMTDEDYKVGVTVIALSLLDVRKKGRNVKLYAFALMSNHLHELLAGSEDDCMEFFRIQKKRLSRFFSKRVSLANFECRLVPVPDVSSLQNEICYIHRNGFLVHQNEVPYSYEWSTGLYYFNRHVRKIPAMRFADLKYREKREITRSVVCEKYDDLMWVDGYMSPLSFCEVENGEKFFRSAHQYFHKLSRNYEAYSLIAQKLGDEIFLSDEDMYSVLCSKAKTVFGQDSPRNLSPGQRLEMAKLLHKDYNASNVQIKRMLNLSPEVIQELFPKAK